MYDYVRLKIDSLDDNNVDTYHQKLLENNYDFMILYHQDKKYALTKERSLIEMKSEENFLHEYNENIYYKTIISHNKIQINQEDLQLYMDYIGKYRKELTYQKFADKYYFGCVAVKSNNGFITTIRGKDNLEQYTIVENVDHKNHIIHTNKIKASLNSPLLDYLFQNLQVKAIVHLHHFYDKLPFYEYAFPGTVKDSIRDNSTSFNIQYHGVVFLFNKNGNMI